MVDTTIKTKAAMLHELESIKGLLLEEDDIPILQEMIDVAPLAGVPPETVPKIPTRIIVEEQQDFFAAPTANSPAPESTTFGSKLSEPKAAEPDPDDEDYPLETETSLLNTLEELEKHTAEVTANKFSSELHKAGTRPNLAKATGENPFLPAHIRSRLHGNNPPPLFAQETAKKIATASVPSRLLGNTSVPGNSLKSTNHQQNIIDSIIDKLMPEIEKELRARLELMSKNMLDELHK